eukprot:TRINITY_DN15573_c0_g1_i3.p4 TRINITY_DN15573_c0_g1~~TRINITY_DN15573_c0_g1_i3.p4  ORF type:complete len:176 (+),score=2.57 TRINITY_DN15573_c0_g1_i3:967-1494(+)
MYMFNEKKIISCIYLFSWWFIYEIYFFRVNFSVFFIIFVVGQGALIFFFSNLKGLFCQVQQKMGNLICSTCKFIQKSLNVRILWELVEKNSCIIGRQVFFVVIMNIIWQQQQQQRKSNIYKNVVLFFYLFKCQKQFLQRDLTKNYDQCMLQNNFFTIDILSTDIFIIDRIYQTYY